MNRQPNRLHHWKGVLLILLILFGQVNFGFGQSTLEKFGKNRVQYKRFYWRSLSTVNFDVYHYDNGARLANFATRFLELEFDKITEVLGYTPYLKTKIFIYNSISDLQQSNVGIDDDNVITGGQTDFFKSQVEIPYTGSEVDFKMELRRGIALMLIREMMFGGSLKDMLQSSYLGKFSEWFLLGAAAYVADGWSQEMDDHVRDLFSRRRVKKPNLLSGDDAILVGQSIWNYIAQEYGATNISNILNLARIIRNERNAIGSSLGIRYKSFLKRWENYYQQMADETKENTEDMVYDFKLRRSNRRKFIFNEFKVNPDGTRIAYSENRNGKYCVVVQNLQKRKKKRIIRTGYKAINQRYDEDIPLLSWRDNNNLGVMLVKKGEVRLITYNMKKKKSYQRTWFYFNHVSSFDFSDDGNYILLSADRKGQSNFKTGQNDIFLFDIEKTNLEQLTDDWYDDLNPVFAPNSVNAFTFSSNRINDTLSTTLVTDRGNYNVEFNNFDIFYYNARTSKTRVQRLTNSLGKDTRPRFLDPNTIIYLNDEKGINQLHKVDIKTGRSQQLTNANQNVRRFEVNPSDNGLAYLMIKKERLYPFYKQDFDFEQRFTTNYLTPRILLTSEGTPERKNPIPENFEPAETIKQDPKEEAEPYAEDEIDTDNYVFEKDILEEKQSTIDETQQEMLARAKKDNINIRGPYDYETRFRTENVVTSIQIDPLRGWGVLLNLTTSDLLENHKIRGGFFLITDLRSSDFFAEYQYYAPRLDYKIRYDRKGINFGDDVLFTQTHSWNKVTGTISYPINNLSRISISPFYLNTISSLAGLADNTLLPNNPLPVGTTVSFISTPTNVYHYVGYRAEYVYDNTVLNGQNMISGTRAKIAYENYVGVFISDHLRDVGLSPNDKSFSKISVDVRNYMKIHKDLIFASRVAYGRFAGNSRKNFSIGGMDNWLFNQRDNGGGDVNPIETSFNGITGIANGDEAILFGNEDLLFNEFATNLRGFDYNRLSGENFILANLEIRFPIVKYLFGKRISSNFLKNLQLVGFYDIGTAWTDTNPFRRNERFDTRFVGDQNSPFFAEVNDFTNPWLAGYGAGLRTVLLGYYLKVDMAWAIEDFQIADRPRFYFTFGYDF